jgi:hypothetical protein
MKKSVTEPQRLTRAESFLGFHFDFHATTDSEPIGGRPFRAELESVQRNTKPDYDYVHSDASGHSCASS